MDLFGISLRRSYGLSLIHILIVLVGLDGDTSECRIAGDVVRLAQHAMTGGETALEQATQIDLAARSSERVEMCIRDRLCTSLDASTPSCATGTMNSLISIGCFCVPSGFSTNAS